jgi:small glutamine-rich tetratricopeptide repeat-containing protein alpha
MGLGNMAGMADMLRGMGGGAGGGGGMPDIMSMMQNPQMMSMVNNMMANGGLESLYVSDSFPVLSTFF